MLRYLTAGESHGGSLIAIVEGLPAGLDVSLEAINEQLTRRQGGYGRGARMNIEQDAVTILSGTRQGVTIGSPVTLQVMNKDDSIDRLPAVTRPRPGHADLTGALKYHRQDVRDVLERASARETAARVAVGALCRQYLSAFGVEVFSHVVALGGIEAQTDGLDPQTIQQRVDESPLRCADPKAEQSMIALVDRMKAAKNTLGGVFEVVVIGAPVGLGSYVQYDRKLDSRMAAAILSIQAMKAVEVGRGCWAAQQPGSEVHDEIFHDAKRGFYRESNNSGGVEGGMSTGEPLLVRGHMKPLSTLYAPKHSVDIVTKEAFQATVERSDVCAVPAAGVVGEAVCSIVVAQAIQEKFGGDSMDEALRNHQSYVKQVKQF